MLIYNKKGELTTTQLVSLIILIISFVVILFLIFQLNLGETSKAEICRDSVILKSKSVLDTPLNCKTSYICFSKTSKCDKIDSPDEIIKVSNEEELYKELADKMADCWWMFGEGKFDYVGKDLNTKLYCSICSNIYFDSSVKEIFGGEATFSQEKLYDYISKKEIFEGEGYDMYLYGQDFNDASEIISPLNEEAEVKFSEIELDSPSVIMMGITSEFNTLAGVGALIGGVIGTVIAVLTPVGWVVGAVIVIGVGATGATIGTFAGLRSKGISGNDYLRPIIIGKNSEEFSKIECEEVVTLS